MEKLFEHNPTKGNITFTSMFKLELSKESSVQEHQDRADRLIVKKEPDEKVYYHRLGQIKNRHHGAEKETNGHLVPACKAGKVIIFWKMQSRRSQRRLPQPRKIWKATRFSC